MRNGDYLTTRFNAQLDTVEMIFRRKIGSNPESSVGLISMSGDSVQVLATLTTDFGRILSGIHQTHIKGKSQLVTGLQVAALALKHRQNKVQHQRIVCFVGSPVEESEPELEKLAKRLKKNNVAVDFINFGEESKNTSKLEKFISLVNIHDNSNLVTVPPGPRLLYECVGSSAMFEDDSGMGMMGAGDGFDFGDASMDPELALALSLSLEEDRARQERERNEREKNQPSTLENVPEEANEGSSEAKEADTDMKDAED